MRYLLLSCLLGLAALSFTSCGGEQQDKPEDAIARVGDKYLSKTELGGLIPDGTSAEDSTQLVENFVQNWVREQLILARADRNLPESEKDFNEQLEHYQNSLLIYKYEQLLIRQRLDTLVSDDAVAEYYSENKENFTLRDAIGRVDYIKVLNGSPKLNKVGKWFSSGKEEDAEELQEYCLSYAKNFSLKSMTWVRLQDVQSEFPEEVNWEDSRLIGGSPQTVEDSLFTYLIKIRDYQKKNGTAPLSYVRKDIENIIINKRKLDLIHRMKKDIYLDAEAKGDFEVYSE